MKIVDAKGSNTETYSEIDLVSDIAASPSVKKEIKREVGDFLVEQIILAVSSSKSPVSGESWKKTLTQDYAKKKAGEGGAKSANMELSGEMLDSLTYKETKDGIILGVFGDAAARADGHNNLSGESQLPQRRFLPDEGQSFKRDIQSGIEQIIADKVVESEDISKKDLSGIETKSELYEFLKSRFEDMSIAEIRSAVLRSEELTDLLDELNILDLL